MKSESSSLTEKGEHGQRSGWVDWFTAGASRWKPEPAVEIKQVIPERTYKTKEEGYRALQEDLKPVTGRGGQEKSEARKIYKNTSGIT